MMFALHPYENVSAGHDTRFNAQVLSGRVARGDLIHCAAHYALTPAEIEPENGLLLFSYQPGAVYDLDLRVGDIRVRKHRRMGAGAEQGDRATFYFVGDPGARQQLESLAEKHNARLTAFATDLLVLFPSREAVGTYTAQVTKEPQP